MFPIGQIHCYDSARKVAKKRLPWMVFDYIDGAAGEETGLAMNRHALQEIRLQPRILVDVSRRDLSVDLFGKRAKLPFGITPMGMCNLSYPGADLMLARKAAKFNVPVGVSTMASTPMEEMIETAEGNAWFQLYISGDGSTARRLVERAGAAGYETLVVTLDVPELGRRPRELHHGFKMPFKIGPRQFIDFALHPFWSIPTLLGGPPDMANFRDPDWQFDRYESRASADWEGFARLRDQWKGNLVVKGVLSDEDAIRLKQEGADAIQVSSHGSRQLDGAIEPILALSAIREAVGREFPLFYDSAIRSGEDVVKAYAMGADFVLIGRALLYAMAAKKQAGLDSMWQILTDEVGITLAQIGKTAMNGLDETIARRPNTK